MSLKTKRIVVPILIVLTIIGLYFVKNSKTSNAITEGLFTFEETKMIDYEMLKRQNLPILINYSSRSCAVCKELIPVLEELNKEYEGKAIIKFIDVRKYPAADDNVPVLLIPTQVFINADGTPFVPKKETADMNFIYNKDEDGNLVITTHQGEFSKQQFIDFLTEMGVSS